MNEIVLGLILVLVICLCFYSLIKTIDTMVKLTFERYKSETFRSLYVRLIKEDFEGVHVCGIAKGLLALAETFFFMVAGVFIIPVIVCREIYKNTVKGLKEKKS